MRLRDTARRLFKPAFLGGALLSFSSTASAIIPLIIGAGALVLVGFLWWFGTKSLSYAVRVLYNYSTVNGSFLIALIVGDTFWPHVDQPPFITLMRYTMLVVIPILEFAIIYTAIKLIFSSIMPSHRYEAKAQLKRLIAALIIISISPYLFQVGLNISQGLTRFMLGYKDAGGVDQPGVYSNVVSEAGVDPRDAGFATLLMKASRPTDSGLTSVTGCLFGLTLGTVVLLVFRYIAVIFLAAIFPITIFLYLFDFTKSIGREMLKYTIGWILTPFLMSIWLVITASILVTLGTTVDYNLGVTLAMACMVMVIASPLMVTGVLATLGAVVSTIGQMTPSFVGVPLVAAGEIMQGQSAEAVIAAGLAQMANLGGVDANKMLEKFGGPSGGGGGFEGSSGAGKTAEKGAEAASGAASGAMDAAGTAASAGATAGIQAVTQTVGVSGAAVYGVGAVATEAAAQPVGQTANVATVASIQAGTQAAKTAASAGLNVGTKVVSTVVSTAAKAGTQAATKGLAKAGTQAATSTAKTGAQAGMKAGTQAGSQAMKAGTQAGTKTGATLGQRAGQVAMKAMDKGGVGGLARALGGAFKVGMQVGAKDGFMAGVKAGLKAGIKPVGKELGKIALKGIGKMGKSLMGAAKKAGGMVGDSAKIQQEGEEGKPAVDLKKGASKAAGAVSSARQKKGSSSSGGGVGGVAGAAAGAVKTAAQGTAQFAGSAGSAAASAAAGTAKAGASLKDVGKAVAGGFMQTVGRIKDSFSTVGGGAGAVGKSLKALAAFGAISAVAGTLALGGGAIGAAIGMAPMLYAVGKLMQWGGVGKGLKEMTKTAGVGTVFQGIGSATSLSNMARAWRSLDGASKGMKALAVTGMAAGLGLKAGIGLLNFGLLKAPSLAMETAMSGGYNLPFRAARGAFRTGKSVVQNARAYRASRPGATPKLSRFKRTGSVSGVNGPIDMGGGNKVMGVNGKDLTDQSGQRVGKARDLAGMDKDVLTDRIGQRNEDNLVLHRAEEGSISPTDQKVQDIKADRAGLSGDDKALLGKYNDPTQKGGLTPGEQKKAQKLQGRVDGVKLSKDEKEIAQKLDTMGESDKRDMYGQAADKLKDNAFKAAEKAKPEYTGVARTVKDAWGILKDKGAPGVDVNLQGSAGSPTGGGGSSSPAAPAPASPAAAAPSGQGAAQASAPQPRPPEPKPQGILGPDGKPARPSEAPKEAPRIILPGQAEPPKEAPKILGADGKPMGGAEPSKGTPVIFGADGKPANQPEAPKETPRIIIPGQAEPPKEAPKIVIPGEAEPPKEAPTILGADEKPYEAPEQPDTGGQGPSEMPVEESTGARTNEQSQKMQRMGLMKESMMSGRGKQKAKGIFEELEEMMEDVTPEESAQKRGGR